MSMSLKFKGAAVACLLLASPLSAQDVTADTVVATVNGQGITVGHMIAMRESLPQEYLALPDDLLFNGVLDQLIQQTALAQLGEDSISRRDELILETQRLGYLAGIVLDDTAIASVTDETLQAAYDAKYANAAPSKEFNASHILVETEEDAAAIKAEIDGGMDFTEVAKTRSTGPSGPNGGELGWFGLGMMVEPFETAVIGMEAGDVSGPVQTQFGWHIIRLNETRMADAPALDAVRDELAAEVQEQAVMDRVTAVTEQAEVVRSDEGLDPAILKDTAILGE
ncbi:peptidylprolyl isomerase [Frigidibacter albus]|uniref:Parvulin-like PPIase n=1 Tax=Frigidibacter albus TaxID=1465486 RepID=A0A6L8VKC4_9RHOB|nr:peptidylprolyl isomerase [Frigidibacter albus]MZQ89600.1 peptidylprolyl isomerase [Frigidibacter albus]NBE31506.1 peptidylprolyl isomerase [Frigidibacter albus]GGH55121.1 peptidylprolyl isomerase [Frigidibacter albus]